MRLNDILKRWRQVADRTVRDVAKEIGVTASTLSRIERGQMPDAVTLSKILIWVIGKYEQ